MIGGYYKPKSKKLCKKSGCNLPPFSHGYCSRHRYMWAAKQPIPKYKPHKTTKTQVFGFRSLPELFQHCYYISQQPIICPVSGEDITPLFRQDFNIWKCCCAHVLPRSRYPLWRLNPHNIILVHPLVHKLYDQGTQSQRDKYPNWNWKYLHDLRDQLKSEYSEYLTQVL